MAELLEFSDADAALDHYIEHFSDGLPVVLPTERRVAQLLAATTREPDFDLGAVPPGGARLTVRDVAVNAVLAGCPAPAFPIALTAVEAALEPAFNLNGIQSTTHSATPLIVVSGPAAARAGMNASFNAFGPHNRANAAVGRTLRLVMANVGGGLPGKTDMSVQGSPAKYTFCAAENLEQSPWPSLAEREGYAPGTTSVTLMAAEDGHVVADHRSADPERLLENVADVMRALGTLNACLPGPMTLALCPQHARIVANAGWSVADVQRFLYERAANSLERLTASGEFDRARTLGVAARYGDPGDPRTRVPVIDAPESLIVCVVGAPTGGFSTVVPSWLASRPVHRPV
ncbi:MAG TPA: hypothetical protein VNJ51_06825 [Candidatus Dormibacteraeota bacterium]|nr:hypothetical protein [Candidatus Dormibacteraeota bacterium]